MPRIILTALIFVLLLSLIAYSIIRTFSIDFSSYLNFSFSKKQYSNFYIDIEAKEFLLSSEIEKITLKSRENYSIMVEEIILDTKPGENNIFNFSGNIQKKDDYFSLIGRFSKANINEVNITGRGKEIKISNKSFDQINLNNFNIDYIKFENVSGLIKIPKIEINLENAKIEILGAFANLTYNKTIKIEGVCTQIKVNNKLLIASS